MQRKEYHDMKSNYVWTIHGCELYFNICYMDVSEGAKRAELSAI